MINNIISIFNEVVNRITWFITVEKSGEIILEVNFLNSKY